MSLLPQELTQRIRSAVDPESLLRKINHHPETIQVNGQTIKAFCPVHKEIIFRTLIIDLPNWTYRCSHKQCPGGAGGDMIDLYARVKGINYEEAVMDLAGSFGVEIDPGLIARFVQQTQEIADNFVEMGVHGEAEAQYDLLLRLKPDSVAALRGLVRVYTELGNTEKTGQAMIRLAKVLIQAGEDAEAARLMEDYVREHPRDAATRLLYIDSLKKLGRNSDVAREYVLLAEGLTSEGKIDDALKLYREVETMRIDAFDVSHQIIQVLTSAGRQDEAVNVMLSRANQLLVLARGAESVRCLQTALDIDPARDDIRVRIAEVIGQEDLRGEVFDECCAMIRRMIRSQAHGPAAQALDRLIHAMPASEALLDLKGDLEEARGHDESALEIRIQSADLFAQKREFDQALSLIDRALLHHSDQPSLLSRRGEILRELGRATEAAETYRSIIAAFEASGDFEQAAAAYQAVIDLEPDDIRHRQRQFELYVRTGLEPLITARAVSLAETYRSRGEHSKAAGCMEQALRAVPENPDLLALHAGALEDLNRKGEAAEQFLAAAKIHVAGRFFDHARNLLELSLRCMPEHMEARELRADVLIEQKLIPQAIHEYEELAQFYSRAGEPGNVLRIAGNILRVESDHLPTMQLVAAAYGQLGRTAEQRDTRMRLISHYRRLQSYTPAAEICETMIQEDEGCVAAVEQLLAIAESTRRSEDALRYLWRLAQIHAHAGRQQEEQKVLGQILQRDPLHQASSYRHLELTAQWGSPKELGSAVELAIDRYAAAFRTADIIQILEDLRLGSTPKPEILAGIVRLRRLAGDTDGVKDALRTQATLLARALRDEEAIEIWGALAQLLPEDLSIRRARIDLMVRSDEVEDAAEEYRFIARFHCDRGQLESAEGAQLEILRLLPEDRDALEALIDLYIRLSRHDEAGKSIETLAALDIRNGNLSGAVRAYERCLEFHPEAEEIHRKIIALQQRSGDIPAALRSFNRLLDLLASEGRSGAFEQAATEAIALDPINWDMRGRLADHLLAAGRLNEAEGALREMAHFQIKSRLYPAASETIERILGINADSVQGRALRAELFALQGKKEMALAEFMELAGNLSELRLALNRAAASPFAFGNYEGLTRVKEYTFEQFVVGPRNNFAHATAQAAARGPGKNYNPLFLYADVGLGKTHLCHAVANYVLDHHPNLKVLYTMTEDFVEGLIDAIQHNTVTVFRNRHRLTDVLVIDDIQFLSGKERAQEEFFHIFNALFESGKQIIITSDRPPKDIAHLEKRLRSRFGAGIIVDIQPPDLETRIAIIRRELIQRGRGTGVSDTAVFCLAESIPTNIRDLKGALTQVLARHDVTHEPIDSDLIHAVVDKVMDRV